jgi:hypothetical protein
MNFNVDFQLCLIIVIILVISKIECNYIALAPRSSVQQIGANSAASIEYNKNDLVYVNHFLAQLKKSNGDWSKHGVQRIIRLASECSNSYLSLRNFRIKADVPIDEAFKDPYSKYFTFKSITQTFLFINFFLSL